jgi:hypothetical protein
MNPPLREVLTVVRDGLEVPGLVFYGLLPPDDDFRATFPFGSWPAGTKCNVAWLHGEGWRVVLWEVAVAEWPKAPLFQSSVRATFEAILKAGASVVWIGQGYFCDPPLLFSKECMSGGVLAAALRNGRMWLSIDPDEPLNPLPDEVLIELRAASAGLSDIGSQ